MTTIDTVFKQIFVSHWLVITIIAPLLLLFTELGYQCGLRLYTRHDEARKGSIGGAQGAVLALLGLLLAFTYSMAESRYEMRRGLVLHEANAIGTTYLRASFLPEPHKTEAEKLLRQYIDARIAFYDAGESQEARDAAERQAATLQAALWSHTVAVAAEKPSPIVATFITSLNETIDLDATRLEALRMHVPGAVWLLVLIVAFVGCWGAGDSSGACGARSAFANIVLPLLVAVVITIVADLDRPTSGLIVTNQQPLLDLKEAVLPKS